jgi:hypothetical protein
MVSEPDLWVNLIANTRSSLWGTFGEESTLKLQMEKVVGFKGMDMTNTASI